MSKNLGLAICQYRPCTFTLPLLIYDIYTLFLHPFNKLSVYKVWNKPKRRQKISGKIKVLSFFISIKTITTMLKAGSLS